MFIAIYQTSRQRIQVPVMFLNLLIASCWMVVLLYVELTKKEKGGGQARGNFRFLYFGNVIFFDSRTWMILGQIILEDETTRSL